MQQTFVNEMVRAFWLMSQKGEPTQRTLDMPASNGKPRIGPFTIHFVTFPSFEQVGVPIENTIASPHYENRYRAKDSSDFCRFVTRLTRNGISIDDMHKVLASTRDKDPTLYYNDKACVVITTRGCFTLHLQAKPEE